MAVQVGRGVTVVACDGCGGDAQPLTVAGAEESFSSSVRQVLAVPIGVGGLLALVALAAVAAVAGWLATQQSSEVPWLDVAWSLPAVCLAVAIVRATAERPGPSELPARIELGSGLLAPALRLVVLLAPVLLLAPLLASAGRLGLALVLGAIAPLVLARLVSGASLPAMLDGRWLARAARAVGRDGLLAAGLSSALFGFAARLWSAAGEGGVEVPPLWSRTAGTAAALALFLVPQLAGLLVRAHAEALGVELQAPGRRPAWPGAVPRRSRALSTGDDPH